MRIRKLILGGSAALIAGAALSAQNLSFHGYMDYTNFGVGQQIYKTTDTDDWEHTEPAAEFGSFYNGRTELNVTGGVGPVSFATGVRLDAALGEWYNNTPDVTDLTETMFHQANVRVSMWQDQLILHTGKFEEWNCGFILNGYAMGGQRIADLAMRDWGMHITGLEWVPNMNVAGGALTGLRLFAGIPVLPPSSGYDWTEANAWDVLFKKTKVMASYKWLRYNVTFVGGFHNEYYTGRNETWAYEDNYTKRFFSEAFVQADLPTLIRGVRLNVTYDIRWRDAEYNIFDENNNKGTWEKTAFAHYVGVSGLTDAVAGWPITFEDRFFYSGDHYDGINEKGVMNALALGISHRLAGTSYSFGLNAQAKWAHDANGTLILANDTYAPTDAQHAGGIMDFHTEWMAGPKIDVGGASTRYLGFYAKPYFQKDFSNGFFQVAVEVQYINVHNDKVDGDGITYRVPLMFCFWF